MHASSLPYYECNTVAGDDKPWLTLVHGASQNHKLFSAQIETFQQHYRLLLIDLPGHGQSSAMSGPFGLEEYAHSVATALAHAGIDKTHFWGTHTGAGVGLLLAARGLSCLHSLVLEGPVLPGVDMPSVITTIGQMKFIAQSQGMTAARKAWFEQAQWFDAMRNHPQQYRAAEQQALIAEFDGTPWLDIAIPKPVASIVDQLPHIGLPILLINGEHDLDDFLQTADLLKQALPLAQRAKIAGGGGFPLWELPQEVNPLVLDFLAQATQHSLQSVFKADLI